jgi:hypothetical protein
MQVIGCRGPTALRVVGDHGPAARALEQPVRHLAPDRRPVLVPRETRLHSGGLTPVVGMTAEPGRTVATHDPDQIRVGREPRPEPAAVLPRDRQVFRGEDPRAVAPRSGQLVTPAGHHRHVEAQRFGLGEEIVDALKVRGARSQRVGPFKRQFTPRARGAESVGFRQERHLDHCEPLPGPGSEIVRCLFARAAVHHEPGRVAQPEERAAIIGRQIVTAGIGSDRVHGIRRCAARGRRGLTGSWGQPGAAQHQDEAGDQLAPGRNLSVQGNARGMSSSEFSPAPRLGQARSIQSSEC